MKRLIIISLLFCLTGCGVKVVSSEKTTQGEAKPTTIIKTPKKQKVTLNVVDWSDSTKKSRIKLHQRFMAEHPNVTINYTTLTQAQFNETMLAGIRTGKAPDLFPLPSTISFTTAINEGWFLPLSDYIKEELLVELEATSFQKNVTIKDDKLYLLPEVQEIPSTMLFYNETVLKKAGISTAELPTTWPEFLAITKRISEKGQGDYFGLVTSGAQKNRLELELRSFSELAGANLGPSDQLFLKAGKTQFAEEAVIKAFDLYHELYQKGSFHPDSALLSAPEARKVFAENKAAFIIQGAWCIPIWQDENPQLAFGVSPLPKPDVDQNQQLTRPFTKGWMGISATSKHPDVAAAYLEALYAYDYQAELVEQGGFISIRKDLGKDAIKEPKMAAYYRLAMAQSKEVKNPLEQNQYLDLVYANLPQLTPDFGDIGTSLLSGNREYQKQLKGYDQKIQESLENVITRVNQKYPVKLTDFNYQ